ncbi:hypothetical protein EG68_03575 [Paragonimus skrjabini miyazakii]|uniref:Calx-beta domain-containing protein n=1 Tax=Paragonimus skrjabini miyazakii TaxID=59628 RepID=A0A8S9YWY4_9TREM|nr:hypothetical protein EG68_03575 [Paragonimus skrjabini miyazakii]
MAFVQMCFVVLFFNSAVYADKLVNGTCPSSLKTQCVDGILIPKWEPSTGLSGGDKAARATIYFACLLYLFLGVSIIADRFMAAIEVITSKEKAVTVRKKNGEKQTVYVRIWNATVSNLTLMALGSSAPEILLSIIEIVGKDFEAGDLGPGTIVGSAAFNLFVIIGVCILVVPDGQVRRIKHLSVFFITASWSVFAYLWMYLIIAVFSPGVVEVWEALLTFVFFPLIVICAYLADTKIFFRKFMKKKYRVAGMLKPVDGESELGNHMEEVTYAPDVDDTEVSEFERNRLNYVEAIKDIRKKNPDINMKQLEEMAQLEVLSKGPKSRAFYRMQATRQLTGSGNVIKKSKVERRMSFDKNQTDAVSFSQHAQRFFFNPGLYTVMENVGTFPVTVTRIGGDLDAVVSVNYSTVDGTAVAGEDYVPAYGTLVFKAGETHKQFSVTIIDDDIFEEDEHFTIMLSDLKVIHSPTHIEPILVDPSTATVMVLDDDHSGIFHFESDSVSIPESCAFAELKVMRVSGCRGIVRLPFHTIEGTAKGGGKDFEDAIGVLEFQNDQTEGIIRVRIMDDNDYEKSEFFYVQLGEPILLDKDAQSGLLSRISRRRSTMDVGSRSDKLEDSKQPLLNGGLPNEQAVKPLVDQVETGKPRLGEWTRCKVTIVESYEFRNTVDRLVKQGKWALVVGTSSWKEQFVEAVTVSAGGESDNANEEEEEKLPSCMNYVMHFLTVFWKVLFAFVPPTDYGGGWWCFTVCIVVIGVLTAVIGDMASSFGCCVGLTDAVTAITFVALGTSLPDTFASKVAAVGDADADSSIGNVTGSNAVNVFLGIGVAWSMAAIYHAVKGTQFLVKPGSLGFSVTVFCIFALVTIAIILLRRRPSVGGELGGPRLYKYSSGLFFFLLWFIYIVLAGLENYCHIEGF